MANGPNLPPSYGLNDLGEYKDLGRGPVTAYFRRVVAPFVPSDAGTLRRLAAFSSNIRNWGKWASHVMRYITSPKHAFLNYGTESGVYAFDDKCKLAVAGDWGTGTDEAQHVMSAMKGKQNPDYTVHLGDVYYVGDQRALGAGGHSSESPNADSDSESESREATMKSTLSNGTKTSGVVRELKNLNFSINSFVKSWLSSQIPCDSTP